MSIAALLQAAEFLERRDRVSFIAEAEHGYASTLPFIDEDRIGGRRSKARKSQGSRTTHNELEKNRRAHLRSCLEKLKDMVPLGPESSRHTTLGLLTKAKRFIKSLEEREKRHWGHKEQLAREQRYLRRRLGRLLGRRRAPSESSGASLSSPTACSGPSSLSCSTTCSTCPDAEACCSSASSSSGVSTGVDRSPASVSESDEVDVIGYTSYQSDTDERCSLRSGDSGLPAVRRTRSRRA